MKNKKKHVLLDLFVLNKWDKSMNLFNSYCVMLQCAGWWCWGVCLASKCAVAAAVSTRGRLNSVIEISQICNYDQFWCFKAWMYGLVCFELLLSVRAVQQKLSLFFTGFSLSSGQNLCWSQHNYDDHVYNEYNSQCALHIFLPALCITF